MPETELLPVYLITGGDLPKIAFALGRLRSRFAEGSVDHRFAESSTGEDVVQALNALGLFGGGERLVVVEAIERWKKADADVVALYLESPTPGAVLALVGDASKLGALVTSSGKAGEVLNYDLPKKKVRGRETDDFPRWVQGRFERAGVRVDRDVAERLVEIVHEDHARARERDFQDRHLGGRRPDRRSGDRAPGDTRRRGAELPTRQRLGGEGRRSRSRRLRDRSAR